MVGAVPGTMLDERKWHVEMKDYRRDGEWFSPHPFLVNRMMSAILNKGRIANEIMAESRTITRLKRLRGKRPAKTTV